MKDPVTCFITWTTCGTWLPGDARGWSKRRHGVQTPEPLLEEWCRRRMAEDAVVLNAVQRGKVEAVCREHARIRSWILHPVSARSNHVHLAVTADKSHGTARDQFQADATRVLREGLDPIVNTRVWTRGGHCEILYGDEELEPVIVYIDDAQDRMDRGKP